jgi:hypothetical protein
MEAIGNRKEFLDIFIKRLNRFFGLKEHGFEVLTILPRQKSSEFSLKLLQSVILSPNGPKEDDPSQEGEASKNEENQRERGKGGSHRL